MTWLLASEGLRKGRMGDLPRLQEESWVVAGFGGQKTSFRGPFSASTLFFPGLEHRLGRLAASAFTPLSHRANIFFYICSMLSLAQNSWAQVTRVPPSPALGTSGVCSWV